MRKVWIILIFVAVTLALYFFTPVRHSLSPEGFAQWEGWIRAQGIWAPFVFGIIYVGATVFALPGSVLTLGGGLLFGPLWGTLINWSSATVGATICFLLSHHLGRNAIVRLLQKRSKLLSLDEKIGRNGFYSVLFMRLVPLFPFNGLNFGLGLTKVSLSDYVWATALGMLPGAFVYTSLGAAGRHIQLSDPQTWLQIEVWGPFALVILLSLLPRFFRKK